MHLKIIDMEFKGTKGKWEYKVKHRGSCKPALIQVIIPTTYYQQVLEVGTISSDDCTVPTCCKTEEHANALLISKAPEMLEMLEELSENLALQLDRLGCCGEGDGKGRKADNDSFGGNELLLRSKQLIKEATEL